MTVEELAVWWRAGGVKAFALPGVDRVIEVVEGTGKPLSKRVKNAPVSL